MRAALLLLVALGACHGQNNADTFTFIVPSGSMLPTLVARDRITVVRARPDRPPRRGDVIVFPFPEKPDTMFVKRVVGLAGDTVGVREGRLYVNGTPVPYTPRAEPCPTREWDEERKRFFDRVSACGDEVLGDAHYTVLDDPDGGAYVRDFLEETVPPGTVFVLGDNRANSHDSRFWGPVKVDTILGIARP